MSLTKLYKPSETALRQLFNRQFFLICVLSSNGKMAPNSAVSHEITSYSSNSSREIALKQCPPLLAIPMIWNHLVRISIMLSSRDIYCHMPSRYPSDKVMQLLISSKTIPPPPPPVQTPGHDSKGTKPSPRTIIVYKTPPPEKISQMGLESQTKNAI